MTVDSDDGGLHVRLGMLKLLGVLYCLSNEDSCSPVCSVIRVVSVAKIISRDGKIRF